MKIRIKGTGAIKELSKQDFFHMVLIKTQDFATDYDDEKLFEIRNKLHEKDFEYTLEHYDEFIEEFGLNILAEMIDVEIKKY